MMRDEQDILRDLIVGKSNAFDEMYALYADRIWRFLMRLTQNRTLAEDLFQETWLAAASHVRFLRSESSLSRWLYTIARNAFHMSWRKFKTDLTKKQALQTAQIFPSPIDEAVMVQIDLECAQVAMQRLPEAYREVLILCCLEELSSESAALILGATPEAVRKRLSRARSMLTTLINELNNGKEISP